MSGKIVCQLASAGSQVDDSGIKFLTSSRLPQTNQKTKTNAHLFKKNPQKQTKKKLGACCFVYFNGHYTTSKTLYGNSNYRQPWKESCNLTNQEVSLILT